MSILKKLFKIILITILGLLIISIVGATIYNQMGNCKVEGRIEGLGTRLALVSGGATDPLGPTFFKIILVFNDKFAFKANYNAPGGARIMTQNMFFERANQKTLWMRSKMIQYDINPNESITIEGKMKAYSIDYSIKGNDISVQTTQFRTENLGVLESETQLALKVDSVEFVNGSSNELDSLRRVFDKTREEYTYQRLRYAIKYPSYELSARYLGYQNMDSIVKYLPLLSQAVQNTEEGKLLKIRALGYAKTQNGNEAPDILSTTQNNVKFNLADLRGKYVVLDFWGSWCGWCIQGFPKMKQYYERYKRDIEFVSIACRDNTSDWNRSIKENELTWVQLLNNDSSDISARYNIESFPTKILIDKDGRIVAKYVGESDIFYNKLDLLFQKAITKTK